MKIRPIFERGMFVNIYILPGFVVGGNRLAWWFYVYWIRGVIGLRIDRTQRSQEPAWNSSGWQKEFNTKR